MQAIWNNTIIAEAEKEELIRIEGNWYFPPSAIKKEYFEETDKHTTCFWKGLASYYRINVDGVVNEDGAWYYPNPLPTAKSMIKKDISNYVAFWHGVEIVEASRVELVA